MTVEGAALLSLAALSVLIQLYVCPHTTVYVSSYDYIAGCFALLAALVKALLRHY